MADPVLHLLSGPNGAGKSTLWKLVLDPVLHLEFVSADGIAQQHWPAEAESRSYEAARLATARRHELLAGRASFATETVFSHESKVDLVSAAVGAGYLVTLHVVGIPEGLAVARVADRVANGGHTVPAAKVRERYRRLWRHVAAAILIADQAVVYDNTMAREPFRPVAGFERGMLTWSSWPAWAPRELQQLG